ncbi:hypothetical protein P43SY_002211 [Pythium insidiosum]|uniref:Transmembrane protein n=1 Tax=Pythium insidiosum TaxID=114742 RepID=A0AAD5QEM3_PYTIN|nr:hypothetical protein P43SY_002211 [Pythium insidiosum]
MERLDATRALHDAMLALKSVSWETYVVALEILLAVLASLYLLHRKMTRDVLMLGGDLHTLMATSPLVQPRPRRCSVLMLLSYRCAVTFFYVVIQLYDIYRTEFKCLAFYTSWNFILQGSYFAIAASRTHSLWKHKMERPAAYTALLDESTGFMRTNVLARATRRGWLRLDLILDVCLSVSLLIGVVVWTILYPYSKRIGHPEVILNWVSYCQHGVNILLLQIDNVATHHGVSVDALPLVIAWPTAYCIFAWVIHGTITHGFWPYPFLRLDTPWAPVWYGGLLVAHLGVFVLMLYLSKLKDATKELSSPQPQPSTDLFTTDANPFYFEGADDQGDDAWSPRSPLAASHELEY